jgi:hypothetical protein
MNQDFLNKFVKIGENKGLKERSQYFNKIFPTKEFWFLWVSDKFYETVD